MMSPSLSDDQACQAPIAAVPWTLTVLMREGSCHQAAVSTAQLVKIGMKGVYDE